MSRPRRRPDVVSSLYFKNVTPLWVGPGKPAVDRVYHEAAFTLADWTGPDWPDNEKGGFFPLREYLIQACERWRSYNWEEDRRKIEEWRRGRRYNDMLLRSIGNLKTELKRSPYGEGYRDLGISIVAELAPTAVIDLTYQEGIKAVQRGLDRFTQISQLRRRPCRYGCIEYLDLPRRLPRREVAIALALADLVTGFRRDPHQAGALWFPRPPVLSPRLPWKAIGQFAGARSDAPDGGLSPENIQTLVTNLARQVSRIWRFPERETQRDSDR